jgi:diacylglycerol diphosphate phosphatase/phosphatidate phosphatase
MEKHTDMYHTSTRDHAARPEGQKDRWRRHYQRTISVKDEKHVFRRFFSNLKVFLLDTWFDIVCILITCAIAGGVWVSAHTHNRLFPVTFFESGDIVYPSLAYPYVENIFSAVGAGLVAGLVPLGVILIAQIWERSFFDFANAILGLAMSLAVGTTFQVILKKTIGGLRPHFLAVCQPVIPDNWREIGVGYGNIMFTVDQVCTGDPDKIYNAIESFPSGHSNIAFAGLGYLAIYLFTHLRVQNLKRRAGYWKMGFVFLPVLMATYLASTLVLGYHHHAYDVIFGSLIGIVMAFFAYRMVFCSIHDPRWNTVPRRRFEREQKESRMGMGRDDEAKVGMQRPVDLEERRVSSGTAVGFDGPSRVV